MPSTCPTPPFHFRRRVVAASLWAWLGACTLPGGNETDDESGVMRRREVLQSVALQVVVPATESFAREAEALDAAVKSHADNPGEATRTAAQGAFNEAMLSWQALEVMQVGPLGSSASVVAGEDLRDEIYSWPAVNSCRVDQRVADGSYSDPSFFAYNLVNAYGLDVVEYLLFSTAEGHTCPPQVQLDEPWAALGAEGIASRRAAYAHAVTTEIARQAQALAIRWAPTGGNFAGALAGPGSEGSPYESEAQAMDELFRAMFYVDLRTKDTKLGRALGLSDGCVAPPCEDLLELPYSAGAAGALAANLRALKLLLTGGPDPITGVGFDDLLADAGHGEIGETLLHDVDAAIALLDALELPVRQVIVAEPSKVRALYDAIKRVTDTLKGPLAMVLQVTIPSEGAGDAD